MSITASSVSAPTGTLTGLFHSDARRGWYLREVAFLTLLGGMFLHVSSLVLGSPLFEERILTPTFDRLFAIPIAYVGVVSWLVRRRIVHPTRWHGVAYGAVSAYFTLSIPLHAATYIRGDTSLLTAFPSWYSAIILPVMACLAIFVARLVFTAERHS
jgi:hypothetical protein